MPSEEDLKLFTSEAEDLVQKVEDQILKLEENPDEREPIKELYFAFHSLKGLTAMVGLNNVSKLCHNFENILDKAKTETLSKNQVETYIDLMFESLDILRSIVSKGKEENLKDIDEGIVDDLFEKLDESDEEYEITFIKQVPENQINSVLNNSANNFYKIRIILQSTCVFKKVRLFIIFRALNDVGQIVWSDPEPEILETGKIDDKFEIYYLSKKQATEIDQILEEILEIENKVIQKLDPKQFREILNLSPPEKVPVPEPVDYEGDEGIDSEENEDLEKILESFEDKTGKITAVKVRIDTLEKLMDYFGEVIILKNQLNQVIKEKSEWVVSRIFDNMDKLFLEIQEIIFKLKLVRVETTFQRYKRLVRDVAKETNKDVNFQLEGTDVELDRKILEELNSPLIHLLRNAIYHGIENPSERERKGKPRKGSLTLKTYRRAGSVFIDVIDDGKGIDYEKIRQKAVEKDLVSPEEALELSKKKLKKIIFARGFSTLTGADLISGRGMGLAIVAEKIKELGGELDLLTEKGEGTTFRLTVPFSRAILKAQLFKIAGDLYAIPIENINQIYFFKRESVEYVKGEEYYRIEEDLIPIIK
ncbi:MAG: ATP-binding protein, partial [Promethearchaeia archaeon]